jgi:signal transduction histidine kinase/ActR/RegA family two-component response regulator
MDDSLLVEWFHALDSLALELTDDGTYRVLGTPPTWILPLWPKIEHQRKDLQPAHAFPFLENFEVDAQLFWTRKKNGHLRSGIWIETNGEQQQLFLEATAVLLGEKKMLLIELNRADHIEKQFLVQTGRDLALEYQQLESYDRLLEKERSGLAEIIRARTMELERSNARLAQELAARKQIEKERLEMDARLRQAQKMEAIGILAGGIAHDFNNILSAVIGFSEIVMADLPEGYTAHQNLKKVLDAGYRAKDLVRQILTFSRQSDEIREPVKVTPIVREVLRLLRATLPATIEIIKESKSDSYVMADPTQIHQIIMNLCTNAAYAMQDQGGELRVYLKDVQFQEKYSAGYLEVAPGKCLQIVISDTGQGIPAQIIDSIFDPFFTTKKKGEGTGMGLSLVHGILKSLKGTIGVESLPGQGASFSVYIPVHKPGTPSQSVDGEVDYHGRGRILFVDDEPMQTDVIGQMLRRLGYEVLTATSGEEALKIYNNRPESIDLVITDMTMPKMTGIDMASKMLQIRPDLAIILCSGFSETIARKKAEMVGIQNFLTKPILYKELSATVKAVISKKGVTSPVADRYNHGS